jgi:hypothetical protein
MAVQRAHPLFCPPPIAIRVQSKALAAPSDSDGRLQPAASQISLDIQSLAQFPLPRKNRDF